MKQHNRLVLLLIVCVAVVGAFGIINAQEEAMIEPLDLTDGPVVLSFSLGAAGPPTIEPLTDGRMTFRIQGAGEISGDLTGSLSARISEVTAMPPPPFHPVTVIFTIETESGQIDGFYAGSLHRPDGAEQADITASGTILSVSGAYADLYLADVTVSSQVQFVDGRSVGESGTLIISAR